MEPTKNDYIKALCITMWCDEVVQAEYNYNKQSFLDTLNKCDLDFLQNLANDFGVYAKNGKTYTIDKTHTNNNWYMLYTVYEVTENNKTLFKGKYKAMSIKDVLEEL